MVLDTRRIRRDLDVVEVIVQCIRAQYGDSLGGAAAHGLDLISQRVVDARAAVAAPG